MSQFETITKIGNAEMSGKAKIAFATLSAALVIFSLYTAMFGVFPDMIQRGAHISAVIGLSQLIYAHHVESYQGIHQT